MDVYSACNSPSVEALIRYFHVTAGCLVKDMGLKAIKAGSYALWTGITCVDATKYCPPSDNTIKGHMVQTCQNVQSKR